MIENVNITTLMSVAAATTALGGAWLTIRKIAKDNDRRKKQYTAEILQSAKEADQSLKVRLESKVHELEIQLRTLKENVDKDITHLRETYNGEIKFLGQKIEELRSEVRNQHAQLVQLLTKMIDKN